jgi:hypothetical protein
MKHDGKYKKAHDVGRAVVSKYWESNRGGDI